METPTRDRLRKKLNKKKGTNQTPSNENNIFDMLNQVNQILKQNPEMVSRVNKCVSTIVDNKDLMSKLTSEIQSNIEAGSDSDSDSDSESTQKMLLPAPVESKSESPSQIDGQSQIVLSNLSIEQPAADSNESKQ